MIGTGIDIVDSHRIRRSLLRHGEEFSERVFTMNERLYCSSKRNEHAYFAEFFAAKEALVKALGTGFIDGITLMDVEVTTRVDGRPEIKLYGKALQKASELNVKKISLSLSHATRFAVAFVILDG